MQPGPGPGAEEEVGARPRGEHIGEILRPHVALGLGLDGGRARDLGRDIGGEAGLFGIVHRRRIAAFIGDLGAHAIGLGLARNDGAEAVLEQVAHHGREGADRRREPAAFRDDVVRRADVDLGHRDHRLFERGDIAADDRLQRADHAGDGDDRIGADLRRRAMAAAAGDGDPGGIDRRHQRPGRGLEMAERQVRRVVDAVDLGDGEALHHALAHHHLAAAALFLGGLEEQHDGAGEIARLAEVACRAQQHRGVPVMAAGMHPAGVFGGIVLAGDLLDRQRVHVGAQPDRRACRATADHRDDARARHALVDLVDAEAAQLRRDEGRGLRQVEFELGVAVQPVSPFGHLRGKGGDAVDDGHGGL
ncbi:hypothetical protein SDC9_25064 [bioreactor metagenome]|uniref:Uncharacterized protein n=1 Tax=bioreactor metagenome TaxID=1076179 RepID=A0A644UK35_9ZZZZ